MPAAIGQVACAAWDFNGDGSLDLAAAFTDGRVVCYYNDALNKPLVRLSVRPGLRQPVTVSLWQSEKSLSCLGTYSLSGPAIYMPIRQTGSLTLRYSLDGKAGLERTINVPEKLPIGGLTVVVEP